MGVLPIQLPVFLKDVFVNTYILSTHQPFTIGTFVIGEDYGQSIVFFNAAMIMVIYICEFLVELMVYISNCLTQRKLLIAIRSLLEKVKVIFR